MNYLLFGFASLVKQIDFSIRIPVSVRMSWNSIVLFLCSAVSEIMMPIVCVFWKARPLCDEMPFVCADMSLRICYT